MMSQVLFMYFIGHFGAKTADILQKSVKLLHVPVNNSP
jgi:hypothetical protein